MAALRGLAFLLLLQTIGELLAHQFRLPVPGPVIGMVVLLPALGISVIRDAVAAAAAILLNHLSLLFVPVGVGVITHLDLVARYGIQLLLAIVLSTWAGMAVTAFVFKRLLRNETPGEPHHD